LEAESPRCSGNPGEVVGVHAEWRSWEGGHRIGSGPTEPPQSLPSDLRTSSYLTSLRPKLWGTYPNHTLNKWVRNRFFCIVLLVVLGLNSEPCAC
jgi:hypothetical protein